MFPLRTKPMVQRPLDPLSAKDRARIIRAAELAKGRGNAIGELVERELTSWLVLGHNYGAGALTRRLVEQIEQEAR